MDWPLAISRNRDQLRQIVLALFALAGMRVGGSLFTLRRDVFGAIMLVLRPAESAVRRLIMLAARGLTLAPQPGRAAPVGLFTRAGAVRTLAFALLDPLKTFDLEALWGHDQPLVFADMSPYDPASGFSVVPCVQVPVSATLIGLRLNALMRALDDLPRQARRLLRWQARRDLARAAKRPSRCSPMRPGLPPGWRQRKIHEIDEVLRECHGLALYADANPDTS